MQGDHQEAFVSQKILRVLCDLSGKKFTEQSDPDEALSIGNATGGVSGNEKTTPELHEALASTAAFLRADIPPSQR